MQTSKKLEIVQMYQRSANDTASPEVQVALLTHRINHLTGHFQKHVKDFHGKRGLLHMINARRKLLSYLKSKNSASYFTLIKRLELRK